MYKINPMKNYQNKEWLEQEYITKKKSHRMIALEEIVNTTTIENWCKKYNIKGRVRKYEINEDKIDDSNLFMWYFLGLFMADGWSSKNNKTANISISLVSGGNPKELLNEILKEFEYSGVIYEYSKCKGFTITNKKLGEWLAGKGAIIESKTFNCNLLQTPNENQFRLFLRGLFDGDGNIKFKCIDKPTLSGVRILTASKSLADTLNILLEQYIGKPKIIINKYYTLGYYDIPTAFKFLNFIYGDSLYPKLKLYSKYTLYRILKMMI